MKTLKIIPFIFTIAFMLLVCGCGCKHQWTEADCQNPRTCSECGETEGTESGHKWKKADCLDPKTCEICGLSEGEPKGHAWFGATCEKPDTCRRCREVRGEPLGHDWNKATCTSAKRCAVCGAEDGSPSKHKWKDATCTEPKTCEVCGKTSGSPNEHSWKPATCISSKECSVCGLKEGGYSGHSWTNATISAPKTCTVCGRTEGSALNYSFYGRAYITTKVTGLNLRAEKSTDSKVLTVIPKDALIDVYSCGGYDWFYTEYDGKGGYISSEYLTIANNGFGSDFVRQATVTTKEGGVLNLRKEPDKNSEILDTIPRNTVIYIYGSYGMSDEWYYVEYNGKGGYVSADYVTIN